MPYESLPYDHYRVSDLLDELAKASNCIWNVSPAKELNFMLRTANDAPWDLTDPTPDCLDSLELRTTREDLANHVYLRCAKATLEISGRAFNGDGSTRRFYTSEIIGTLLKVYVNSVLQDFGVYGVDTVRDIKTARFVGSGLDDLTSGGTYVLAVSNLYTVEIDGVASPNTFKWRKNSGSWTTGVAITGAAQALADGVTATFDALTGHTLTDTWYIACANKPWLYTPNDHWIYQRSDRNRSGSNRLHGNRVLCARRGCDLRE